ncbi:GNAT family N-acetyltransferase [Thalassotalea fusca]
MPYDEGWTAEQEYQGVGCGAKLMLKAEKWALENGFSELASDTALENTMSFEIRGKLGFVETERVVCFIKKLK